MQVGKLRIPTVEPPFIDLLLLLLRIALLLLWDLSKKNTMNRDVK